MKKIIALIAVVALAALSCIPAFAAGINSAEQSVLNNMRTPSNMNGNAVYVPDSYINQAEANFNTIDMTQAQADEINGYINAGRSYLESTKRSSYGELSADEVKTFLGYARAAAGVLDLSAGAGSDLTKGVKIINKSGDVVIDESGNVVKATGAGDEAVPMTVIAVTGTLLAVSCAGVLLSKRKTAVK